MHGETVDVDDASLRALGIHRLEIPVPFLEAGGPANVYAIEDADGRWTLFDTGIGTEAGVQALREGAARAGVDLRKVSRVVVSHGHLDHFGNAQLISEESGARVFIHDADREKVIGDARFATLLRRHRGYFLRLGVPVEQLEQMQAQADRSPSKIRYVEPERLASVAEGDVLHFRHFEAVVKHLPGHTPGLICLYAERPRVFFADDHVLARVSPNPVLDLSQGEGATKFRALSRYLEGARWVRELELELVLPGHGPAFTGHRALLDGLFGFYERRQGKLLSKLVEGPASVFELLPTLFPRRDLPRLVLMLSEVLANLEVLEDQGRVRPLEGDVVRYAVA
jgi:glyoxylase-like metal-dependent hydrolase (beta-lactamase superfamily II)